MKKGIILKIKIDSVKLNLNKFNLETEKNEIPQFNLDVKSIKEMQRFKELYEKFKHLAGMTENINENIESKIQVGFNRGDSGEFRFNNDVDNKSKKKYHFNDDL